MTAVSQFLEELGKRPRVLVGLLVALVAVGVAALALANRNETRNQEAMNALYSAEKALESELKAIAQASKPAAPAAPAAKADPKAPKAPATEEVPVENVLFQPMDVDQKLGPALAKFKSVAEQYSGTRAGYEATLAIGDAYFRHGEPAKAVSWYEKASQQASGGFEKAFALSALGHSLENSGKFAEAIQNFDKALKAGQAGLKGELMLAIARCHESLKDTAKARSTYDEIIKQLPKSEYAQKAETLKAKLQ